MGMFKSMNHSIPTAKNGTVEEPNTKFNFPIHIPRVVINKQQQKTQQQKIFGLTLWVYTIPLPFHPHVNVAVVGLYLDEGEGKRRMAKYRMKTEKQIEEKDLINELVNKGKRLGMTLKYKMAGTPPNEKEMLDGWIKDLKTNAKFLCEGKKEQQIEEEVKGFADFVNEFGLFKKGQEFNVEKDNGELEELYGYVGEERKDRRKIGNECLSKLFFYNEISQRKESLSNLFHDVFEK